MSKETFIHQLKIRLSQLPDAEIEKHLSYYSEIIDDMVEDGMSEEAAVATFGDVNKLAAGLMANTPLKTLVKSSVQPKNGWTTAAIVIAIIGSPIWVPLALIFIALVFSAFLVICALIFGAFACVAALGVTGVLLIIKSFMLSGSGVPMVIFTIGAGFGLIGACLLAYLGARIIAIGLYHLMKIIFSEVKGLFIKNKGEAA